MSLRDLFLDKTRATATMNNTGRLFSEAVWQLQVATRENNTRLIPGLTQKVGELRVSLEVQRAELNAILEKWYEYKPGDRNKEGVLNHFLDTIVY